MRSGRPLKASATATDTRDRTHAGKNVEGTEAGLFWATV